jgi:hypothetical protein
VKIKIYILPVDKSLQPENQPFLYPKHNRDYGVEQDFVKYLHTHPELCCNEPEIADFHYLPVYWTRWHLNHNYGSVGLGELQAKIDSVLREPEKTFTICQYDDGPLADLRESILFLASRKSEQGKDIPLLSEPISTGFWFKPKKRFLACFLGRKGNHAVREAMFDILSQRSEIYLFDGRRDVRFYRKKMLQSYIALCPRGYGGSSFRFFEAMQLGLVPMHIGKPDTRPFKGSIDWDACSLYVSDAEELGNFFEKLDTEGLIEMGRAAKEVWKTLQYGKWPHYVIQELEALL